MKETKFNVWDKILKQWLIYKPHPTWGVHLYYTQDDTNNSELQWCIDSDDFEVVQYTGLKDKNGKEIFEGDILEWNDLSFVVYWCDIDCGFGLEYNKTTGPWHDFSKKEIPKYCEIIGNIYENKELLK